MVALRRARGARRRRLGSCRAAALSSWLGRARPASQALLDLGPLAARRCTAPPKTLAPPPPPALGPGRPRSPKRPKPNLRLTKGGLRV